MYIVDHYSFGKISISSDSLTDSFTSDVIILPDTILTHWWRMAGHNLCLDDLSHLLERSPKTLVIGTGYNNRMTVPNDLMDELESLGIKVLVKNSREAVEMYNQLARDKKEVALAIHLTC